MVQKVCLDTDVTIAILNNEDGAFKFIERIEEFDVFISTITLFELLQRETNLDIIEVFRDRVKVLNFDELSSRKASSIYKDLKKKGKIVDFRDVFIASICLVNNCKLATLNGKHFENIEGLNLI
ncbi:type II toxin-antitoxin system VapC family toxin [Candidatus Woesearchaeota archaeon]|nr:type II toxin-antitoxin system VapC family toxin [Candidatus Woesearchaeota archaeon]